MENQTNINWFPGHMAKARREMSEKIKVCDMLIEIRDSRIPLSSTNPLIDEIAANKPRLIILSKKDKSESAVTEKWIKALSKENQMAIALNLISDRNIPAVISEACSHIMEAKIAKLKAKGLRHYEIKAMVAGIPNVGKSTLINSISKKKVAKTADHPGVTKNLQWIKVSPDVALLDTPGVLWPKFEDQIVGYKLAVTGAINDNILPLEQVEEFAIEFLIKNHPEKLVNRYGIEVNPDIHQTLNSIGVARGCIQNDGTIDEKRLATLLLKEIRDNQLGPISWEMPDENC